jgi:hypothetical protein
MRQSDWGISRFLLAIVLRSYWETVRANIVFASMTDGGYAFDGAREMRTMLRLWTIIGGRNDE